MWVYRSAARDRWFGNKGGSRIQTGSVSAGAVFVLWAETGSPESAVLGGGWICTSVQAVGEWTISMAADGRGGTEDNAAAISLAHGRAENTAAKGNEKCQRTEHEIGTKITENR